MSPEAFWTMVTALGTGVVALATSVLAIGVYYEVRQFRIEQRHQEVERRRAEEQSLFEQQELRAAQQRAEKDQKYRFYAILDSIYFDLQKQIISHPHLASPYTGRTVEEKNQYNAYAFMVWNFLESVHDYSQEDKILEETWGVIMKHEGGLHSQWFLKPENQKKFKALFRAYALTLIEP